MTQASGKPIKRPCCDNIFDPSGYTSSYYPSERYTSSDMTGCMRLSNGYQIARISSNGKRSVAAVRSVDTTRTDVGNCIPLLSAINYSIQPRRSPDKMVFSLGSFRIQLKTARRMMCKGYSYHIELFVTTLTLAPRSLIAVTLDVGQLGTWIYAPSSNQWSSETYAANLFSPFSVSGISSRHHHGTRGSPTQSWFV